MVDKISLDYLKTFYEVAKTGNITKAAEKFYISQPAVTQTLNKLESVVGQPLLIRNNKGVSLTSLGQKIFEQTNNIILLLNNIDEAINESSDLKYGRLYIGSGTNLARHILMQPLEKFVEKYPDIEIKLFDDTQNKMLEDLKLGDLDICFSQYREEYKEFLFAKLFSDEFVFVCKNETIKNSTKTKFIVQSKGSYNHKIFENYITTKNFNDQSIQTIGYNAAISLAQTGAGIALVPKYLVEEFLKNKELIIFDSNFENAKIDYGYYINKYNITKAIQKFTTYL